MIRFHIVQGRRGVMVSSYRRPRGFIVRDETFEFLALIGQGDRLYKTVEGLGFRPIGLNGRLGPVYKTRAKAVEALLTRRELQGGEFGGRIIPNLRARRPKKSSIDSGLKALLDLLKKIRHSPPKPKKGHQCLSGHFQDPLPEDS